jgi:hypothetical protein
MPTHATLDEVEAALFTALLALRTHATPAGPFVLVDRWAGEVTQDGGIDSAILGKSPSALLAFEESVPEGASGSQSETGGHLIQVVERHVFRVYVTVLDARGDKQALKGTVGQTGALACAHRVKLALAGLVIPGLFDGDVVRLVGHRPWLIKRGTGYTHLLRFSARAALDESTEDENPTPGVPLGGVRGDVQDATPDTDGATVTLSTFDERF